MLSLRSGCAPACLALRRAAAAKGGRGPAARRKAAASESESESSSSTSEEESEAEASGEEQEEEAAAPAPKAGKARIRLPGLGSALPPVSLCRQSLPLLIGCSCLFRLPLLQASPKRSSSAAAAAEDSEVRHPARCRQACERGRGIAELS